MYKIEVYIWSNDGLKVVKIKAKDAREAMDMAYSQSKWDVLKVFDEDGEMYHMNSSKKDYEQYA